MWCAIADPRYTFTCEIWSQSVYSVVLWRRKTPIFFRFFGLWHLLMSSIGIHLRKLNTGAQLQTTCPQSNGIKIVSVLQRLHGKIRRTISHAQKRDEQTNKQTDKQTKNSTFWPPRRRVKSEPHQTWHGDRGPRARSCTCKTFGV